MSEKKEVAGAHQSAFESIRKVNQHGRDFWSARIRLMAEIDKVIDAHGGWPKAFESKK